MRGARTIEVLRFLHIGPGLLADLPALLDGAFDTGHVLVATGESATGELADRFVASLAAGTRVTVVRHLGGSLAEAHELLSTIDAERPTLVVAIGGGRPIDVAKLAAARGGVEVVVVPTSLSHDAMASPVASLHFADGVRRSIGAGMPAGVAIDLDIVRDAPPRNLRAGIGDLASNLTAVLDWRLAHRVVGEPIDEFAASLAMQSAQLVLGTTWPPTDEQLETIARGLVMSGLAMEIAGTSRPCSGADHLISHSLDELLGPRALLHGEQVAIGSLIAASMHGSHLDDLRALFERCGMPVRLRDCPVDLDVLADAVVKAPATRPDRFTILSEAGLGLADARALVARALDPEAP
jgi:glycerol-1-phosphate dehydrogenase [NAD(P)+]